MEYRCGAQVQIQTHNSNSNQTRPLRYLSFHFAADRIALQIQSTDLHNYGKGCARWIGNSVWGGPPVQRDQCQSPLTPITTGRVGGGHRHAYGPNETSLMMRVSVRAGQHPEEAVLCATVTPNGRAPVLEGPRGLIALITVTPEPGYRW